MKGNKIYLIISGVIQIIFSSYMIVKAREIVDNLVLQFQGILDTMPDMPVYQKMMEFFSESGVNFIKYGGFIGIFICLILMLIVIFSKNYDKYKGLLITLSVISIFLTQSDLVFLLIIGNIIVIAKTPNDKIKEKREIPVVDLEERSKKSILKGIIIIGIYFLIMFLPFDFTKFIPEQYLFIFGLFIYIFLMLVSYLLFRDELKEGFKLFKNNFLAYKDFVLPRLGKMYLVYFAVATIVFSIFDNTTVNQMQIYELPKLVAVFLAVIYAPLVEETVFRGGIRKLIKNDKIYILVSGLIFGLIHTLGEDSIIKVFVMCIPYSILGGFFAYLYTKTNNLSNNIICHMLHNAVASLVIILI